jgi:hypothetical protein
VPVYAGESSTLIPSVTATVQKLSGAQSVQARPVLNAPPSGDPASSTIHLFYGLPNADARLKPGERVLVSIPVAGNHMWTAVPWSSIVFDTNGGTWLYESLGARRYSRRRVDVDHNAAGVAYLNAGVSAGTQVVTQGAAELWGFEFGTRK